MQLGEIAELDENTLAKYKTMSAKQWDKALKKDTLKTDWYKTLAIFQYEKLKHYEQYEKVIVKIAHFLLGLEISYYLFEHFRNNDCQTHCAIVINQAYRMGVRPLWLSMSLTKAFCQSRLPSKISSLNKIAPVGLIFFPDVIKNPEGKYLKWVLFYHKKPEDPLLPLVFKAANVVNAFAPPGEDEELLYWCTILDNSMGTYGGCKKICIEDDKFYLKCGESFVYESNQKTPLDNSEQSFTDKVTDLIIQTLLYMQMEKIVLPPMPEPQQQGFGRKSKTHYQKISPLIIGENYQIKTQKESTGVSRPHGSPVTHWRSGHWRCQPYGSKDKLAHKTIWIEPILVNKPGGFTQ